jgi:RNA polymerase sigma-70 factor (ECF subfamily)
MDEQESLLVERAQQDPLAFATLYDQYVNRVYNYIFQRTGNHGDAEDLTARTFVKAFVHLKGYRYRGIPFAAWLYRIAHNAVANWHRDSHRHQMVALDAVAERSREDDRPEDLAQSKEESTVLMQAVRSLPEERQELLILKFSEGLSNAEIGQIMHRTEGAIKSLFHRTLMTLREELDRQGKQRANEQSR